MALEYRITLDMEKSDRSPEMVAARVGDKDSVKITASLTNNGSAYTPSGANAYFECVTTADTSVRIAATKSGSSVSVNIPAAALVAPGVITCAYFRFENGPTNNPTLVESTQSFGIIIPDGIGANIEPEDYIEEWRELQEELDEMIQKAQSATTSANNAATNANNKASAAQTATINAKNAASAANAAKNNADAATEKANKAAASATSAASSATSAANNANSKAQAAQSATEQALAAAEAANNSAVTLGPLKIQINPDDLGIDLVYDE